MPKAGWAMARFASSGQLAENERLRAGGVQRAGITCVAPSAAAQPAFRDALSRAAPEADGGRALWAGFVARPRLNTGACMVATSSSQNRRQPWGTYLEVQSVRSVGSSSSSII